MKKTFALLGILQAFLFGALAQTPNDPNEGSLLEYDSANSIMRFKWWGRIGRTYFIQHSDNLMDPWQWVPAVESGNDSIKEWGFTTTNDKFFVRLKYSDQSTTDPEGDDFDLDGVPNLYEVQHGNSPFVIEDSDLDGLPDGWLDVHAGTFAIYPPSRLTASLSRNQTAPGKVYLNNDTSTAVNYSVAVMANTGPNYAISGNASYQWEDISTTGTKLNTISNAWSGYESVNIGFAFPFYGEIYSTVSVDVNGLLVFTNPGYYDYNYTIPYNSTYTPAAMIAPLWDDLETSTSGDIYYKAEASRLIVQYEAVKPNYQTGSYTFQVVLNSNGTIQLRYKTLSGLTNSYTVGIQDQTRTLGLRLAYNAAYLSENMAVDIVPSSEFFTILPTSGTVAPHSRVTLDGLFQSLQLPFGDYTANVSITHDGGAGSPLNLTANLNVKNVPTVVNITSPTNQDAVLQGQPVTITANATDVDSQIVKVEFFDNGVKLGEDTYASYQYSWTPANAGSHTLTAKSMDVYGESTTSAIIPIQVLPDADQDRIDDTWETAYGLDIAKNDAMEDLDGDRVPNIFEYYRETLPNDDTSYPTVDFVVDPATGNSSYEDLTFATIWEAVSKANEYVWNAQTSQYERLNAWAIIEVKSGIYQEEVSLSDMPVLLLAELGSPQGPVEILSPGSYGVYLYTTCALDGFVITHNSGVEGSGVYSYAYGSNNPSRALTNCIIKGNNGTYGGGIYNEGNSILRIAHCTIIGNQASYYGQAIYNGYSSKIELVNSVIWDNSGAASSAIYQDPYAPAGAITGGPTSIIQGGEQGGINENPMVNASGYLLSNSPAINRVAAVLAKASKVDINGELRNQNGTPDLGADEYRDDNGVNDGDGLPDWAELTGASGPTDDADGDGITNLTEYQAGMNPRWNDSDRDGVTDTAEINTYNSNPLSSDSDSDGLSDSAEITAGTGVTNPDSDADGITDGTEVLQYGSNPLSADSDSDGMPDAWEYSRALNLTYNDAGEDPDFDGLLNLGEYQRGTEPWDFDTDGDGLGDGYEAQYASLNPTVFNSPTSDTDNDGMGLLYEGIYGFNPEVADGAGDLDGDGLTNADEYVFESDPQLVDTDDDGLSDFQERALTTAPWNLDTDGDGLTDGYEVSVGLNPKVANSSTTDTDGDGLSDSDEQKNGSNPLVTDTDGDGTNDAAEVASGADPTSNGDGGQAPPPEQKFKVSFEIASGGKTVTASCAKCHNLEVQVGPKTVGTGVTVELERGRSYDIKLKDKPETWRPTGQEPPHDDTATYTLWPKPVGNQTITPSSDEKLIYAKSGEVFEYLVDNNSGLLAQQKSWEHSVTTKTAKLVTFELKDVKESGSSDDTIIKVQKSQQSAPPSDSIAYIEPHSGTSNVPRMPQLEARLVGGDAMTGVNVEWKLEVKYDRGNGSRTSRNQSEDTVSIPSSGYTTKPANEPWKVYEDAGWTAAINSGGFFGGEVTLTMKIGEQIESKCYFRIGGKNPSDALCRQFIEAQADAGPNDGIWYSYAIAKSESQDYNGEGSRYNQFLEQSSTHRGRPLFGDDPSGPGGYGLFQVTGDASSPTVDIPRKQMWNWQENIQAALNILRSKRTTAVSWMTQQRNSSNANGVPLPNLTVHSVTFSEGTGRIMEDAVTMKLYNGASRAPDGFTDNGTVSGFLLDPQGSGHYCFWKNSSNRWALNRYNAYTPPFNYVDRVCSEIEP